MIEEDPLYNLTNYYFNDNNQEYLRMLSTGQKKFSNAGEAVGATVAIVYTFAFIYYLSVKFFNHIIEDIVYLVNYKEDEDKELYRPIVYCMLNAIPCFVFCLSCVLMTNYDSGYMLFFSIDMINICLIYGLLLILVILPIKKEGSDIEGWLLLRDSLWYCVGVICFGVFLFQILQRENNSRQEIEQKQIPNEEEGLIIKDAIDQDISKKGISERKIRQEEGKSENNENINNNEFGNHHQIRDNQSGQDVKPNSIINDDPQMTDNQFDGMYVQEDKFQISLSFPLNSNCFDKFCHVIFFPIHLIMQLFFYLIDFNLLLQLYSFLLPNYHINPSHRKLAASFFISVFLISGLMILLEYLMDNLAGIIGGHNSIYSITVTGLFLQLPFFVYNYQFAKKEKDPVDFFLTFIQLGIFKIGICLGLSIIVSCISSRLSNTNVQFHTNFKIVLLIIIGVILMNIIMLKVNQFKANSFISKYLLFCYFIFVFVGIIILAQ